MSNKPPRTRTAQIRCQPCHYDQILKVANDERDRMEDKAPDENRIDMVQIGNKGILRYFAFFNRMQDLLSDKDLSNVVTESELTRQIMVKQIEKLIIERGV